MSNIFSEILRQNNIDIHHNFTCEEILNEGDKKTFNFEATVDGIVYNFKVKNCATFGIYISFVPAIFSSEDYSNDIKVTVAPSDGYTVKINTSESGISGSGVEFYQNKLKVLALIGQAIEFVIHLHDDKKLEQALYHNHSVAVEAFKEKFRRYEEEMTLALAELDDPMEFTFKSLDEAKTELRKLIHDFDDLANFMRVEKKRYTVLHRNADDSIVCQEREIICYDGLYECYIIENGNKSAQIGSRVRSSKAAKWIIHAIQPKSDN